MDSETVPALLAELMWLSLHLEVGTDGLTSAYRDLTFTILDAGLIAETADFYAASTSADVQRFSTEKVQRAYAELPVINSFATYSNSAKPAQRAVAHVRRPVEAEEVPEIQLSVDELPPLFAAHIESGLLDEVLAASARSAASKRREYIALQVPAIEQYNQMTTLMSDEFDRVIAEILASCQG
jgi:hypothetical protein